MSNRNVIAELLAMMIELHAEVRLAVANNNTNVNALEMMRVFNRPKVPESKSFGGVQHMREIDNFFFGMEQYFEAINVGDDITKMTIATMI